MVGVAPGSNVTDLAEKTSKHAEPDAFFPGLVHGY